MPNVNAPLKVGIIDSGISPASKSHLLAGCCVNWQDDRIVLTNASVLDKMGHGAALTDILCASSLSLKLLVAKVFFDRLLCAPEQIAAALDWQVMQGARLINMSFGLRTDRPVLEDACARAVAAGVMLVAASPARGESVYPASYPGVIRATGDARCQPGDISYLNSAQADFGGFVRSEHGQIAGASVGCAYVTRAIAHILCEQPETPCSDVLKALIAQSKYCGIERKASS